MGYNNYKLEVLRVIYVMVYNVHMLGVKPRREYGLGNCCLTL
jgi:hypothetical protein